ncbi:MAG: RDD family protein [Clostridia bacterium]|nr:RDD family protein [Clostridia bacterium]MBQ6182774.1 RDD family protein [Clostridia bacterium]
MTYELQKAGLWKRISALVLDVILLCVLSAGFISAVAFATGYDSANEHLAARYDYFEQTYNVKLSITNEEYQKLPKEEQARYDEVAELIAGDEETANAYKRVVNLTMLMTSLGIFLAVLSLEFFVPLYFKNGQTVGKKVFNICVVGVDGVRISNVTLFVRSVLGKYAIEIMVPVFMVFLILFNGIGMLGVVLIGLLLILQVALVLCTRNGAAIHDLLASTAAVDGATQKIFDTREALEEYLQEQKQYRESREDY